MRYGTVPLYIQVPTIPPMAIKMRMAGNAFLMFSAKSSSSRFKVAPAEIATIPATMDERTSTNFKSMPIQRFSTPTSAAITINGKNARKREIEGVSTCSFFMDGKVQKGIELAEFEIL